MALSSRTSIITYIYNLLTGNADLKAAMTDPLVLKHNWAQPDTIFPYLVHTLGISVDDAGFYPRRLASYSIDIWSDSPSAEEAEIISEILIGILDELEFTTTEIERAVFELQSDTPVIETEQDIQHYNLTFNLRYFRIAEIVAINAR